MSEFFEGMSTLQQAFWFMAIIGSAVFVVIFLLTLIGGGGDVDMDADVSDFSTDDGGVGFQFFTFKNLIAFFTVCGWTGIIVLDSNMSETMAVVIGTMAGIIMMVLTSLLFFWMSKLTQSVTLKIRNAIGVVGEVYLPIGANRSNIGKVQIKVQGSLRELEAVTDSEEELKTSTIVKVTEVISAEILLVEKLTK